MAAMLPVNLQMSVNYAYSFLLGVVTGLVMLLEPSTISLLSTISVRLFARSSVTDTPSLMLFKFWFPSQMLPKIKMLQHPHEHTIECRNILNVNKFSNANFM